MLKEKRGTKRLCGSCGNKFYDLGRDPIVCPVCETPLVLEKPKPKAEPKAEVKEPEPAPKEEESVEEEKSKAAEPELVSLDDAAAEEGSDEDADLVDIDDDEEAIPADDEEDVFLEDDEDEAGSDVTGIIGGPIDPKDEA